MTDVFGNYVVQKLFDNGSPAQRENLASFLVGHAVQLSLQMYGCRVVQKALEYASIDTLIALVSEFGGQVGLSRFSTIVLYDGGVPLECCTLEARVPDTDQYMVWHLNFDTVIDHLPSCHEARKLSFAKFKADKVDTTISSVFFFFHEATPGRPSGSWGALTLFLGASRCPDDFLMILNSRYRYEGKMTRRRRPRVVLGWKCDFSLFSCCLGLYSSVCR